MVYGQTEITHDLMKAHIDEAGAIVHYEAPAIQVEGCDTDSPRILYEQNGDAENSSVILSQAVTAIMALRGRAFRRIKSELSSERIPSAGWASSLMYYPVMDELLYVNHARGFALCSMRSHTRSRYYVQCNIDDKVKIGPMMLLG